MKNRDYMIYAVDFDGTLCEHKFPLIGEPNIDFIEILRNYQNRHPQDKFILWTCRRDVYLDDAKNWCKKQGLKFDAFNENLPEIIEEMGGDTRKIFADAYIDDKNLYSWKIGRLDF